MADFLVSTWLQSRPELLVAESATVAPTLWLGQPPAAWENAAAVTTVDQAVIVIQDHGRAFLPLGEWGMVVAVLSRMGLRQDQIQERLKFARPCTFNTRTP